MLRELIGFIAESVLTRRWCGLRVRLQFDQNEFGDIDPTSKTKLVIVVGREKNRRLQLLSSLEGRKPTTIVIVRIRQEIWRLLSSPEGRNLATVIVIVGI